MKIRSIITPELLSHIVAVSSLLLLFMYRSNVKKEILRIKSENEKAWAIQESIDIEVRIKDRNIGGVLLMNAEGHDFRLIDLLKPNGLNIIVVTSLGGCGECRNLELKRWGFYSRLNDESNVKIIALNNPDKRELSELVAEGRAMSGLHPYFDSYSNFRETLGIDSTDTPLIIFVSDMGEVLTSYKGDFLTQERSDQIFALIQFASCN